VIKLLCTICPQCDEIVKIKSDFVDDTFDCLCPKCGHRWKERLSVLS